MPFLTTVKGIFVPVKPQHPHDHAVIDSVPTIDGDKLLTNQKDRQISLTSKSSSSSSSLFDTQTQRRLTNRHVQLIGISGVIGTALFVAIGKAMYHGGCALLLIAFAIWCIPILCITVSTAEMVCYLPISSPFLRLASRCVDESFGFMAGWNFWFLQCVQIPFEMVAVNTMIHYWRDDYSPAIPLVVQIVMYFLISVFAVKWYGETEFILAMFKIILAVGLMLFTLCTMCGANPKHDKYGFRNWKSEDAFKKYYPDGNTNISDSLAYFHGFMACFIQAAFTIAGPDYVSMIAGETKMPRKTLPVAFKQVFYRLTFLFLGGCLCVGIVCSSNSPMLTAAINDSRPGAASSPYVIAMINLGIKVLPDLVNAVLITAAFSAGNAYTYCSSRTLYGLALDGLAPSFFSYVNASGVPIYAVLVSMCWGLLSLLQLGENSAIVLNWIINFITASQLINFCVLCITYLLFRRAYLKQRSLGIDLPELPFKAWFQPYTAYIGLFFVSCMTVVQGYTVFYKANWAVKDFIFSYVMVFVNIVLYVGWKFVVKRGKDKFKKPEEVDLLSGLREIDEHEAAVREEEGYNYKV